MGLLETSDAYVAVSYTHLDVYKRQVYTNRRMLEDFTLIYNYCDQLRAENLSYEQCLEKVSLIRETCLLYTSRYQGFVSKSKIFNSYRQVLVHFSED